MIKHSTEVLKNVFLRDKDLDAVVIRIQDTGAANANYPLIPGLGRVPVGCQIILSDKSVNVYKGTRWEENVIDLKFTVANADVNLRIW